MIDRRISIAASAALAALLLAPPVMAQTAPPAASSRPESGQQQSWDRAAEEMGQLLRQQGQILQNMSTAQAHRLADAIDAARARLYAALIEAQRRTADAACRAARTRPDEPPAKG